MRITNIPPATERAIVKDYVGTGMSIAEIASKYGVSVNMVTKLRKRNGVHRYQTRKMFASAASTPGKEPEPKVFRCPWCNGKASDPEGHSLCVVRNSPRTAA